MPVPQILIWEKCSHWQLLVLLLYLCYFFYYWQLLLLLPLLPLLTAPPWKILSWDFFAPNSCGGSFLSVNDHLLLQSFETQISKWINCIGRSCMPLKSPDRKMTKNHGWTQAYQRSFAPFEKAGQSTHLSLNLSWVVRYDSAWFFQLFVLIGWNK